MSFPLAPGADILCPPTSRPSSKMPADDGGDLPNLPRRPNLFHFMQRKKIAVVRLGSRRRSRSRVGRRLLAGIFRRIRLRWLAAKCRAAMKQLKAYNAALMRDLIEGTATVEAVQSRVVMESYFTAPFFPVTAVNAHYCARSWL